MSMTRSKIESAVDDARKFLHAANEAIGQLDAENARRDKSFAWRSERGYDGPMPQSGPSPDDYSFGSKQTGALRRASLDLTRTLAELRK